MGLRGFDRKSLLCFRDYTLDHAVKILCKYVYNRKSEAQIFRKSEVIQYDI